MITEYCLVKTLVEKENFPVGSVGVVVSVYSTGPACEVEMWNENNDPVDVVTYLFQELEVIDDTLATQKRKL